MPNSSNNYDVFDGSSSTRSNNANAFPMTTATVGYQTLGSLSGWTFTDTAGLLNTYSYNAGTGVHSFQMNAIAVANADYSPSGGINFTGPKWWIPLVYDDGTPVLNTDTFTLTMHYTNLAVGTTTSTGVYFGIIDDPTSTVKANLKVFAIDFQSSATSVPGVAALSGLTQTAINLAGATQIWGNLLCANKVKIAGCGSIDTGAFGVSNPVTRQDAAAYTTANGTQLSLAVLVGSVGTVTTAAGTIALKISYSVRKVV